MSLLSPFIVKKLDVTCSDCQGNYCVTLITLIFCHHYYIVISIKQKTKVSHYEWNKYKAKKQENLISARVMVHMFKYIFSQCSGICIKPLANVLVLLQSVCMLCHNLCVCVIQT